MVMKKLIALLVMLIVFFSSVFARPCEMKQYYGFAMDVDVSGMTEEQLKASMFLNECLNTLTRIIISKDRIVLEEERDRLNNVWTWEGATDYSSVVMFRKELQDALNGLTQSNIEKERYRRIFYDKSNSMARDALLSAISGVQVNVNLVSVASNVLLTSLRSYMDVQKRKDELSGELDDKLWELQKSEMNILTEMRKQMQDVYTEVFKDYDLKDNMAMTEAIISDFYNDLSQPDNKLKTQLLLDDAMTLRYFAPYWYERGNAFISLYEEDTLKKVNLQEAFKCFDKYAEMMAKCKLYRYDERLGMIALYRLRYGDISADWEKRELLSTVTEHLKKNGIAKLYASMVYIGELGEVDYGFNLLRQNLMDVELSAQDESLLAVVLYWDMLKNADIKDQINKCVAQIKGVSLENYMNYYLAVQNDPDVDEGLIEKTLRNTVYLDVDVRHKEIVSLQFGSKDSRIKYDAENMLISLEKRLPKENSVINYRCTFKDSKKFFESKQKLQRKIRRKVRYFKYHEFEVDGIGLISTITLHGKMYYYISIKSDWSSIYPYLKYLSTREGTKRYNRTDKVEAQFRRFYEKFKVNDISYTYEMINDAATKSQKLYTYGFEPQYTIKVMIPHESLNGTEGDRYSVKLCFITDNYTRKKNDFYLTGFIYQDEYTMF